MLLNETGFTFNGEHSYGTHGLIYSERDQGHPAIPRAERNEYRIAGRSGTVLFEGETHNTLTFSGSLYPHEEPKTQKDAQRLIRRVQQWLTAGRQKLIFDYEPNRYYMAQLSSQSDWTLKNWFGGELSVTFEAQPYAYDVLESVWTAAGSTSITLNPNMATLYPAPLEILVTNTGTAQLTGCTVSLDGVQMISFTTLTINNGKWLRITCETPIGAMSGSVNALPRCTAFAPILLTQGAHTVALALTYGSGTPGASVRLAARGRY